MNKKDLIAKTIKNTICHINHINHEPHSKKIIINQLNRSLEIIEENDDEAFEKWWVGEKNNCEKMKMIAKKAWMNSRGINDWG